ncbi:uncharacterized protein LOC128396990 [Panonychus citri]|uniref:uncharacterized protein LOC128396990 n=1 Tax=Panonychus citri TaxID=50023 RepID=UPI0023073E4B|nr:uncharacterized protein LOC128396990 [Panonychus citri]
MLLPGTQVNLRISFTLIILTIYGFNCVNCCSELFVNHLGTTTKDMSIEEGDSMEINCTLFTSSMDLPDGRNVQINSKMLFFKYNGSRIDSSRIQIVDNLTIGFKILSTTTSENGYYMCYLDTGEINVKPKAICATYVSISRPPSVDDNFNLNCLGYDLKNLTCSWDLEDYNIATKYDLSIVIADNLTYSNCPNRKDKNICTFSTKDESPYLISDKNLRFRLDVSNKYGSISKIYQIDHYSNVILSPIVNVYPNYIGSGFAYINWDPPNSIIHDDYLTSITEYQLKVYPVKRDNLSVEYNIYYDKVIQAKYAQSILIKQSRYYNITNLIPFTRYNIEIRCRFKTNVASGQWSDATLGSIETRPDVPYLYPILQPGGFELVEKDSHKQDVVIYFNKVDKININGPNFTYVIKIIPLSVITNTSLDSIQSSALSLSYSSPSYSQSSMISSELVGNVGQKLSPSKPCKLSLSVKTEKPIIEHVPEGEFDSCTFENLNTSFDYKIEMLSYNSLGFSSGSSVMIVPGNSMNKIHPGVDQFYAINWSGDNYTLFWKVSSTKSIKRFTIFWCEVIDDLPQCDFNLDYIHIPENETSTHLEINLTEVKFGISVIDYNYGLSSGIKWANCIENDGPYLKVKNRFKRFNIVSDGSNSIRVTWKLDCPALGHFIDHYEISYCQMDSPCIKTFTNNNISRSSYEYTIEDLKSSTVYNVTIRAVTIRGEILESPTITVETKINIFSFAFGVLVMVIGILVTLLMVYSLFLCTIKKRKDERALKESVDSNWIPKMPSRLKGDANILLNPLARETRNEYENKEYMNSGSNTNLNKLNTKGFNSRFDQQLTKDCKNNVFILSTISGNNQLTDIIPCTASSSSSSVSPSSSSSSSITGEPDEGLELTCSIGNNEKIVANRKSLIKSFSSVSSTSSRRMRCRKLSDGGGCDSEDSGYSTKLSDKTVYYEGDKFTMEGLIKSIDENSPYIVVPEDKSSGMTVDKVIHSSADSNVNNNDYVTVNYSLSDSDLSYDQTNDGTAITINNDDYRLSINDYLQSDDDEPVDINTVSNGYVYA